MDTIHVTRQMRKVWLSLAGNGVFQQREYHSESDLWGSRAGWAASDYGYSSFFYAPTRHEAINMAIRALIADKDKRWRKAWDNRQ